MKIEITEVPGVVVLLNATGSDDMVANAAMVGQSYNGVNVPEVKHLRLVEEMPKAGHWGCL